MSGWPFTSFTFQVEDDGGIANGGVNLDPSPNTMTINVWVPTTSANCELSAGGSTDNPQVAVDGNAIAMGVEDIELHQQPMCIHGASALLPPLTGGNTHYQVTFEYNLFTWDSFNAEGTGGHADTGYWDSFSVSLSAQPYMNLDLTDPINTDPDLSVGFVWGGSRFDDHILECNPSGVSGCLAPIQAAQATVTIPGYAIDNYLNVTLDTKTQGFANHRLPSWGAIKIVNVVQVQAP